MILLVIREQKNHVCSLEENVTKAMKSVEDLEERMSALEDIMKFTEQESFSVKTANEAKFLQNFW